MGGLGGKGVHYRTTCLVALTDRLVCAAVSAGQANTASEWASERERKVRNYKTFQYTKGTCCWLRYKQKEKMRQKWKRRHRKFYTDRETLNPAPLLHSDVCLWSHLNKKLFHNLETDTEKGTQPACWHNTMSLKVVNGSTDTLSPLCVTFVSLCTIGESDVIILSSINPPSPLSGNPLWFAPVHLCLSVVIPLCSPQLRCVVLWPSPA